MREIIIGSRGSQLALVQTNEVALQLKKLCPQTKISIKIIKTKGDKITNLPLSKIGGKGLFIKELEDALLKGEIALAVHSMKDVPTELPQGLMIGAITKRIEVRDVLISKHKKLLEELPSEAVIGTSSLRRKAQLLHYRPDLRVIDLRGNLDTRLKKLDHQHLDAIVVAGAGCIRTNLTSEITQFLPTQIILPAAGQGALGIEIREEDLGIKELVANLNDDESYLTISAERAFLKRLGGGCQIPVGVLGHLQDDILILEGMIASSAGIIRTQVEGKKEDAMKLGEKLLDKLSGYSTY